MKNENHSWQFIFEADQTGVTAWAALKTVVNRVGLGWIGLNRLLTLRFRDCHARQFILARMAKITQKFESSILKYRKAWLQNTTFRSIVITLSVYFRWKFCLVRCNIKARMTSLTANNFFEIWGHFLSKKQMKNTHLSLEYKPHMLGIPGIGEYRAFQWRHSFISIFNHGPRYS